MKNLSATLLMLNAITATAKADPTPTLSLNQLSKQTETKEIPYFNQTEKTAYDYDDSSHNGDTVNFEGWENTYWLNPTTNCATKTSVWYDHYDSADTNPEHDVTIDMLATCNFTISTEPPFNTSATELYCTCFYEDGEECSEASFLLDSYNISEPICEPDNTCAKTAVSKACTDHQKEENEKMLEGLMMFGILTLSIAVCIGARHYARKNNNRMGCRPCFWGDSTIAGGAINNTPSRSIDPMNESSLVTPLQNIDPIPFRSQYNSLGGKHTPQTEQSSTRPQSNIGCVIT